jgi:hypothetical protein
MHLLLSLPTLLYSYPVRFSIEYYLALLIPVAIGDFQSPAIRGGLEYFSYRIDDVLKITMC